MGCRSPVASRVAVHAHINNGDDKDSGSGIVDSNRIDGEDFHKAAAESNNTDSDERGKGSIVQANRERVQNRADLGTDSS
jgi:hypothetical protein